MELAPLGYALVACLAAYIGGALFFVLKRALSIRYLIGFAAGVMLATAFFEMMPEAELKETLGPLLLGLGFFSLYFIEKIVTIHTCPERLCETHTLGWTALIGIAFESLIDGFAIAVGYIVSPLLGVTVAIAIIIHELPRGLSTVVIMKAAGYSSTRAILALSIDAVFTPIGALFVLLNVVPQLPMEYLLAFVAGAFIYIGASDLLPEAHRKFNIYVVLSVILGALLIYLLDGLLENFMPWH